MAGSHVQDRFIPLAITDDEDLARRWVAALDAAGVPVELRIEDARRLGTTSTMLPFGPVFATALYVAADRRSDAAAVLIDLGWDGRRVGRGVHKRGLLPQQALVGSAVAATISGLALVASVLIRGI